MKKLLPALSFAALLTSACNKAAPSGSEAGKAYYEALNCMACHRIGSDGGDTGPDLTFVGFRRKPEWLDLWLKDPQGWRPGTTMPTVAMSDKARAALVAYLSGLKGEAFGATPPWDAPALKSDPVARGRELFARAGCIDCHGKDGRGGHRNNNVKGDAIPALAAVSQTYTKDELRKKISRGVIPQKADPNGPEPLVFMPPWGQVLKDDEIAAVADYLFSIKSAPAPGSDF